MSDNPFLYFKGVLSGIVIAWLWNVMEFSDDFDAGAAERKVEAYRLCMESAGTTRCHMTPDDFIDYYDLKHKLLQEE